MAAKRPAALKEAARILVLEHGVTIEAAAERLLLGVATVHRVVRDDLPPSRRRPGAGPAPFEIDRDTAFRVRDTRSAGMPLVDAFKHLGMGKDVYYRYVRWLRRHNIDKPAPGFGGRPRSIKCA